MSDKIPVSWWRRDISRAVIRIVTGMAMLYVLIGGAMLLSRRNQPLEPVGLILGGPLWCLFCYPVLRLFTREYSDRIGLISLLWHLISLSLYLVVSALLQGKWQLLGGLWNGYTPLCLIPGSFIAYQSGRTKGFARKLSQPLSSWE